MMNNAERRNYSDNFERENPFLERHINNATSRVLAMHQQLDAKVAQKIGFGGNVLDEFSQKSNEGRDLLVRKYLLNANHFKYNKGEEAYGILNLGMGMQKDRMINMKAGAVELELILGTNKTPISVEAAVANEGIKLEVKKKSPILIKRSYKTFSAFVEYETLNEAGDLKLADNAEVTLKLGHTIGRARYTDQTVDWQTGLIGLARTDNISGALIINEEEYSSGDCIFPRTLNLYRELDKIEMQI